MKWRLGLGSGFLIVLLFFFRSTPLYICSCSSRFSLRKDINHHLEHTNTYLTMPNFVYPSKKRELNRTDQLALLEWSSHQQHGLFSKLFYLPAALSQVYQIPGSIPSVAVTEIVLDAFRFSSLPKSWGKVPLTLTNMGRPWVQIYVFVQWFVLIFVSMCYVAWK